MKTLKAKEHFKVGKYDIGWISSDFHEYFDEVKFEKKETPKFQKLSRDMIDSEIENELKPGLCELGDILAFLENPPEESKDGYWNLFYTSSCVVYVYWYADDREWYVGTWQRDGDRWNAGLQVFSPATVNFGHSASDSLTLSPSDTLPAKEIIELETLVTKIQYKGKIYLLENHD